MSKGVHVAHAKLEANLQDQHGQGRDMNVDPTELLGSVADTPEQQQLDGLESEQLNDANF